jgi:ribosomal protein S18 acetylase RimI-like enzyme
MAELTVRSVELDDVDNLLALWSAGGVGGSEADRAEIVNKLDHDPDLFLVIIDDGEFVASIMGTYDGHRGRIKRAVVDPTRQGQGLGRRVVEELEQRFLARGITELRLEVWADNTGGLAFWTEMGWELLPDIRYFQRSIG